VVGEVVPFEVAGAEAGWLESVLPYGETETPKEAAFRVKSRRKTAWCAGRLDQFARDRVFASSNKRMFFSTL
jgi:hypothetical protein